MLKGGRERGKRGVEGDKEGEGKREGKKKKK